METNLMVFGDNYIQCPLICKICLPKCCENSVWTGNRLDWWNFTSSENDTFRIRNQFS